MAIIKCKMCGGDLKIHDGISVAECEYCGSRQTVPASDSEKKLIQFDRAERLRKNCEFDKAASLYEAIVTEFRQEAEAYWGLVLCKYGIEYVDDPATGKKIPTCHRSSFESVMDDTDFEQALENADAVARRVYRDEAKQIEEIRKGIIEVSGKEAPYDIFICYKETSEDGQRTLDSVIAQDVYDALTTKGYRVFFARISLEDKLGQEYEPYIFAALNSAKIMLAFGTDYEYYNAVWVKNEWSRFLKLMEKDKSKYLIPCYKSIDAYDMPKEFAKLQAQDMGKIGATQDLMRGIEKLLPKQEKPVTVVQEKVVVGSSDNNKIASLLDRGNMALEDGDWAKADSFFEEVLNNDSRNVQAYLGKVCAGNFFANIHKVIAKNGSKICQNPNFKKAIQFMAPDAAKQLKEEIQIAEQNLKAAAKQQRLRDEAKAVQQRLRDEAKAARHEENMRSVRKRIAPAQGIISVGIKCQMGLNLDGTVSFAFHPDENYLNAIYSAKWRNIIAVYAGLYEMIGLCSDGTVVACGADYDVAGWRDIVAVAAGGLHAVGLKSNGTVVATGNSESGQCDVSSWCDIVAITAGKVSLKGYTVGLKADGTVVAVGDNQCGQCNVLGWHNIVAIDAARAWGDEHAHTVGLKADGTVVAVGDNQYGQCDVFRWRDIVAIANGAHTTIGLKADGTVVAVGDNQRGQCDVSGWRNIVAIAATHNYTLGLKADGTVVVSGQEGFVGKYNISVFDRTTLSHWKLFENIETLHQEREDAKNRRVKEITQRKAVLESELANLKGLFSGKRRKEIENELANIETELRQNT